MTDAAGTPRVERHRTRGLLIGGVRDVVYPSASVVVPEGSSLYLFSDGVYEVRREDGSMMDLDDFVDLITEHVAAGKHEAQQVLDRIEQIQRCQTCLDDFALLRVQFD